VQRCRGRGGSRIYGSSNGLLDRQRQRAQQAHIVTQLSLNNRHAFPVGGREGVPLDRLANRGQQEFAGLGDPAAEDHDARIEQVHQAGQGAPNPEERLWEKTSVVAFTLLNHDGLSASGRLARGQGNGERGTTVGAGRRQRTFVEDRIHEGLCLGAIPIVN